MGARTPCVSLPLVAKNSSCFSCLQQSLCGRGSDSVHTDDLVAASFAGSNGNGSARYCKQFCEEIYAGLIGASVERRRGEGKLQCISYDSGDGVLLGARMDF